jgi:hypothetical protein
MEMKRTILATALCLWSGSAVAQQGLRAAEGTTSILTRDFSVLSFDSKETSLSLLLRAGQKGLPREWLHNLQLTVSAEDGSRDLFSGGRWVPGFRAEERLALVFNDTLTGGFTALYGSAEYEALSRSVAQYDDEAETTLSIRDRTGQSLSLGVGVNWSPTPLSAVFGLSARIGRDWNRPVSAAPSEVCFTQASAPDGSGREATVSQCARSFFGGVHDTYSGHVRADFRSPRLWHRNSRLRGQLKQDSAVVRRAREEVSQRQAARDAAETQRKDAAIRLARAWDAASQSGGQADDELRMLGEATVALRQAEETTSEREETLEEAMESLEERQQALEERKERFLDVPTFSLIGAVSSDLLKGEPPVYHAALGPALYAPLDPSRIVGALLFELDDLTNVGGLDWSDRFSVRLYIGVPFR